MLRAVLGNGVNVQLGAGQQHRGDGREMGAASGVPGERPTAQQIAAEGVTTAPLDETLSAGPQRDLG